MSQEKKSPIRHSNRNDIQQIHAWLIEEDRRAVEGNFLCNWSRIEAAHAQRDLLVYVDDKAGVPVAFQLGGLLSPGILQVRSEFRGKGIGRKIVERCVSIARERNEFLLLIECDPESSIPFWKRMGFTLTGDNRNRAYRLLEQRHPLPPGGTPVEASVRFYPERRKWDEGVEPRLDVLLEACRTPDGIVHLAKRVLFHEVAHRVEGDPVVEVVIDGRTVFLDKAKYEKAHTIGVRRCLNGYYVDSISLVTKDDA